MGAVSADRDRHGVGLAIFVAGVLTDGSRGAWLLSVGVLVLAVVVVELCLREHFAGFRSHTLLLAMLPVAVLDGLLVRRSATP